MRQRLYDANLSRYGGVPHIHFGECLCHPGGMAVCNVQVLRAAPEAGGHPAGYLASSLNGAATVLFAGIWLVNV